MIVIVMRDRPLQAPQGPSGTFTITTSLHRQDPGEWIHVFSRSVFEVQPDFH